MKIYKNIFLYLLGCIVISPSLNAQIYNDGVEIHVESGTDVYFHQLGFQNQTNGTDGSIDNAGTIHVDRDWTNNALGGVVFTNLDAIGLVVFEDNIAQTIGGTRTTTFENLTINNTSLTGVTLTQFETVNTSLTLTDGNVFSDATNLLIVNDNATSTPGSLASFVDGPLKKIGNDAFVFPLGDNAVWARIGIDNSAGNASTEFTAEYFDASPGIATTGPMLNNVSQIEYWNLDRAVNTDNVPVTLYWEDAARSYINAFTADLVVARYDGTNFVTEGQSAITASDPGDVTSAATVSDFSNLRFTFGSLSASANPLPIELLSFDAKLIGEEVKLDWVTLTEINNDFFTVERSVDAINFEEVVDVDGAGNSSSELTYSAIDAAPYQNLSYYRLKQTDFNGDFSYSNVVVIENLNSNPIFSIYPNPSSGDELRLKIHNLDNGGLFYVDILDGIGREIYSSSIIIEDATAPIRIKKRIPLGTYIVRVTSLNNTYTEKLIVK